MFNGKNNLFPMLVYMKSSNVLSVYFHCFLKLRDISTRFYHGYYERLQKNLI